jgi:hypothetical protein
LEDGHILSFAKRVNDNTCRKNNYQIFETFEFQLSPTQQLTINQKEKRKNIALLGPLNPQPKVPTFSCPACACSNGGFHVSFLVDQISAAAFPVKSLGSGWGEPRTP